MPAPRDPGPNAATPTGRSPAVAHGARNMALDTLLFERVKAGRPAAVRFYGWRPACISLGRNQSARGRYDDPARRLGLDIVRRPTGGLAVYHDRELTYAIACPVGAFGSPKETYRAVNAALVDGLRRLGVDASPAESGLGPAPADASGVCFRRPARGEVVAAGRKLVGSAQRCEQRTILQHGSILLGGDQAAAQVRGSPGARRAVSAGRENAADPAAAAGAITLEELLGVQPNPLTVAEAMAGAFHDRLGTFLAPEPDSPAERRELLRHEEFFRSARWTWRR